MRRAALRTQAGPGPAYTSLMVYRNGTKRPFARRERPALLLDDKGFPTHLYVAACTLIWRSLCLWRGPPADHPPMARARVCAPVGLQ